MNYLTIFLFTLVFPFILWYNNSFIIFTTCLAKYFLQHGTIYHFPPPYISRIDNKLSNKHSLFKYLLPNLFSAQIIFYVKSYFFDYLFFITQKKLGITAQLFNIPIIFSLTFLKFCRPFYFLEFSRSSLFHILMSAII